MVAVIGNCLYSSNAQVISAALKAMAQIIKCPLKSIDKSMPVYIKQTIDIIKEAGSTEAETTQVAFKSLATVLRDCQTAQVKEKDLTYLLELHIGKRREQSDEKHSEKCGYGTVCADGGEGRGSVHCQWMHSKEGARQARGQGECRNADTHASKGHLGARDVLGFSAK